MTVSFDVEGRPPASADESLNAKFREVTPGFFRALKVPLVAGRVFDERDDERHPPVVVVS
jgi:putative ABC transport system permease protein